MINSSPQSEKILSRCLFIADREGDEFELMSFLSQNKLGFIIRSQYNRNITFENKEQKLFDIFSESKKHGDIYSIKTKKDKEIIEINVQRSVLRNISIIQPMAYKKDLNPLCLNLVLVNEIGEEQNPVSWKIWTTEDILDQEDSKFIIDSYSNRWKIEEVNKGAKTGVRIEDRQFTDLDHFLPFISMAFVVAWRMVALRTVVEISPNAPIEESFTEDEIEYMKAEAKLKGL